MWKLKEFIPEEWKNYLKLVRSKLRHPDCSIGSGLIAPGAVLGRQCWIGSGVELGERVTLGDYSYVNRGAIVASATIGRYCSIGPYAIIGMPEHPSHYLSTSPNLYGPENLFGVQSCWNDYPSPPEVGNDVWVGAFAFIRQGVRIGDGAIVGAGAVVTRNVEPYEIVAGVPARRVRSRFEPEAVDWLLENRWSDLDPAALAPIARYFQIPDWHQKLSTRELPTAPVEAGIR